MFINNIKYETFLVRTDLRFNWHVSPPNQSLKLTEVAVDDLTRAKQTVTVGLDIQRADWIPLLRRFAAAA
jgi:hypothetical protein